MSKALEDITAERERQITKEGWDTYHDDQHRDGSLAKAAACYLLGYTTVIIKMKVGGNVRRRLWPRSWSIEWWKPKDRRCDLVRAAALIVAEIERLDRASAKTKTA